MITIKNRLVNNTTTYNPKLRYSVNQVVVLDDLFYQNTTGGNGDPTAEVDWKLLTTASGSGGFNKILQWDGTSTITVPNGYSGTKWNITKNKFFTGTLVGTTFTVNGSTAETDDMLQFTSN